MFSSAANASAPADSSANHLRTRIINAARRLCFADGVEALSARRLANEAGCSPGALYLHFKNLEGILHELRLEGHELLARYLARPGQEMHAADRLATMQQEYHRFGLENPNHFRLMFLTRIDAAALGEALGAEGASLWVVTEAARLGMERGELPPQFDPLVISNVTWMAIHGLTSMVVSGHAAVTAHGINHTDLLAGVTAATRAWLRPCSVKGKD
ncbi:MAG: AcrR family transcriptional regulator [Hyphomicrobiaceae bacterium]|jgi:AcrR family transcriptional regulator